MFPIRASKKDSDKTNSEGIISLWLNWSKPVDLRRGATSSGLFQNSSSLGTTGLKN